MNSPYRPLEPGFFLRPTEELAYQLLNCVLVREHPDGLTAGRIVECEMYQGPDDKGAHSYGGKPTPRTEVMYGPPGYAYVYLIYGMYYCLNLVTAPAGTPHAILIRALEPLHGIGLMEDRLGPVKMARQPHELAAGPGKLCRALGIDRAMNGHRLLDSPLYVGLPSKPWPPYQVARGPRVNIDYAEEAKDLPWRFWVHENRSVSRPRRPVTSLEDSRHVV